MKYLIIIFILLYTSIVHAAAITVGNNDDYYATNANDVTDGLVFRWVGRHQGMSYAQDVSSYKTQGTITGASWGTGTGRGLYFDGVNDYVVFPSHAGINIEGSSSVSICAWICPISQAGTNKTILRKERFVSATNRGGYMVRIDNAFPKLSITYNDITSITSSVALGTSTWNFVLGTYDITTGSMKLYVNNTLTAFGTKTSGIGTNSVNSSCLISNTDAERIFSSYIVDVRIYNRALSSDEGNRIYTATKQ